MGVQLAKAYGAAHIVTSATGDKAIALVKRLGATVVTDYKLQNIFDAMDDNSVDIVYDNYGAEGTADKAMRVIRPGGSYLLLPHGECYVNKTQGPPCLATHPKKGIRELNYDTGPDFAAHVSQALDELRGLVESRKLAPYLAKTFDLADAANAFNFSSGSGAGGVSSHLGKIVLQNQPAGKLVA
eukprot:TRINITY_DN6907_c0_g1_i3.p2 TRINITY_DN6907_c0_g1~~TRINITY_DN6907_c0_g1_i3.p2  ORF type:complete len:184 (+),score=33.40 TRINITY_DN6907_c0_g1_i3:838-1389(+)